MTSDSSVEDNVNALGGAKCFVSTEEVTVCGHQ